MKQDVIRQVKAAEDRAEEKIQEAQQHAQKIIHEARHQGIELHQKLVDTARAEVKERFDSELSEFESELEKVRQTFKEEMQGDTERAQKVVDQVVKFVALKFREGLEKE